MPRLTWWTWSALCQPYDEQRKPNQDCHHRIDPPSYTEPSNPEGEDTTIQEQDAQLRCRHEKRVRQLTCQMKLGCLQLIMPTISNWLKAEFSSDTCSIDLAFLSEGDLIMLLPCIATVSFISGDSHHQASGY